MATVTKSTSNVNKFNPNTGKALANGESVKITGTNTVVTGGQQFSPNGNGSSSASSGGIGKNISSMATSDIQKQLGIKSDNIYGSQTTQAVRDFQKANGLTVDGIVGPNTLAALQKAGGSTTIGAGDLGKTIPTVPEYKAPITDPSVLAGIKAGLLNSDGSKITEAQGLLNNQSATQDIMSKFLKTIEAPASQEDAYRQAQNETAIIAKKQAVNDATANLNKIIAQGEANQLSVVGQGRGIPEAIIGGQQAQFARETAIQALPASAALSAAQGNYDSAKEDLNTLFNIKVADSKAQYEYKNKLAEFAYNFASTQEKTKLETLQKGWDREYAKETKEQDSIRAISLEASKNNAPASVLTNIAKAKDFNSALVAAGKYTSDPLDRQLKQQNLIKVTRENNANGEGLKKLDDTQYSKFTANPNYKAVQDGGKFFKALDDFQKATEKWGTAERLNAKGRGELNSAYKSVVALTKDYYTLGTLDAGVEKLVSLGIEKPGTYNTRDKIVLSAIDTEKKQVLSSINNSASQLKNSVYGNSIELKSLLNESLPVEKDLTQEYTNNVKQALGGATNAYVQAGYITTEQ